MIIVKSHVDIPTQGCHNFKHHPLIPMYLTVMSSRFQRIGYSYSNKSEFDCIVQRFVVGGAPMPSSPLHGQKRATGPTHKSPRKPPDNMPRKKRGRIGDLEITDDIAPTVD